MALKKSAHALGVIPTPVAMGCEVVVCRASYTLTADLAASDIIQLMDLPAGHVPVDLIIDTDDMGTTGTVTFGVLNSGKTDIDTTSDSGGAAWTTGADVNIAATGLRADAAGLRTMSRVVTKDVNRSLGLKLATDTTATSGTIGVTLFYRAA